MLNELRRRTEEHSENFNRVRKCKEEHNRAEEYKNTKTEIKNTLEGINSRFNDTEEWISELEDRAVEIPQGEQKKEF